MQTFDPDTNPYADDLVRLGRAPGTRYGAFERLLLARVIASRMYRLILGPPRYIDWDYSSWQSDRHGGIGIDVIFDAAVPHWPSAAAGFRYIEQRPLIVLRVTDCMVTELFNGIADASTWDRVQALIEAKEGADGAAIESAFPVAERRPDADLADEYEGEPDAGNGNGNGRDNDSGGRGGGPGGGDAPGGRPGSGGVGELINHPVLFSAERRLFESILEQT